MLILGLKELIDKIWSYVVQHVRVMFKAAVHDHKISHASASK